MLKKNEANYTASAQLQRHKAKHMFLSNLGAWALMAPALFALIVFTIRPTFMGFVYAFYEMKGFEPIKFVGFDNFIHIFKDMLLGKALWNTVQYVLWSLLIGFLPPIFVAVLLNELPIFKAGFRFMVYLPTIVPSMVASMLFVFLYYPDASGLLNIILSFFHIEPQIWLDNKHYTIMLLIVSASWTGIGGTVLYYLAAMQGFSRELYEAALIDGAGIFARLFRIMLPQLAPILLLFLVQQMIAVFGITQQPLVMTGGGPDNASLSIGLLNYQYTFTYGYVDKGMALGVVQFFIALFMTVFYLVLDRKYGEN